jgi:hypothetical protein
MVVSPHVSHSFSSDDLLGSLTTFFRPNPSIPILVTVEFLVGMMRVAHFYDCERAKADVKSKLVIQLDYSMLDEPVLALTFALELKI